MYHFERKISQRHIVQRPTITNWFRRNHHAMEATSLRVCRRYPTKVSLYGLNKKCRSKFPGDSIGTHTRISIASMTIWNTFTKRSFRSVVARLYDPLGFIVPATTATNDILKDICQWRSDTPDKNQCSLDWDGPLPSIPQARCKEFRHLSNIEKILRWIGH